MVRQFGLIGHGVVGSLFTRLLRQREARVISYDILLELEDAAAAVRQKILADGGEVGTFEQVVRESEYVLAVTPPQACRDDAAQASNFLRAGQVYCDLASTSPARKQEMAAQVDATGAQFVEGVILGAVGALPVSPEILLGGAAGAAAADALQHYGLRARFYSRQIGPASSFKLIRSVFSKGMETLLIETLLAARRAGLFDDVWREIRTTLAQDRVERMLETWIRSHGISSERRYCEMCEAGRFLEDLGIEPILTRATGEFFRRSNEVGMAVHFNAEPERFAEVIEFLDRELPEARK